MDYKTKSSYERKRQRAKSALEYEQQQSTSAAINLPGPSDQSDFNSRSESASSGEEYTTTASSCKKNIKNNDELITLQLPRKIFRSEKISQMADPAMPIFQWLLLLFSLLRQMLKILLFFQAQEDVQGFSIDKQFHRK